MKPSTIGALVGALTGFVAVLALRLYPFSSALLSALLFPGQLFVKYSNGMGMFGHMIFNTFAYFFNLLLYAVVGYGIGWLFEQKHQPDASRG